MVFIGLSGQSELTRTFVSLSYVVEFFNTFSTYDFFPSIPHLVLGLHAVRYTVYGRMITAH